MSIDLAAIDAIDVHTHAQVPRHGDLNAVQSELRDGHLHFGDQPGFGLEPDWKFVERYRA